MNHKITLRRIKEAAIRLFRNGYTEAEIIRNKKRLIEIHKLGSAWDSANRASLNRWIKSAKEDDPDLEIWHLLNRRRRRPNWYTNWQPNGKVMLAQYYEPLEDTLYLGPGVGFIPTGNRVPSKIVETDPDWRNRLQNRTGFSLSDTDAVGPCIAELKSFGYSFREIVTLWGNKKTRHPDRDNAPRIQFLIQQIRSVREAPMSYTTVRRILQTYSFEDTGQMVIEVKEFETGDSDE